MNKLNYQKLEKLKEKELIDELTRIFEENDDAAALLLAQSSSPDVLDILAEYNSLLVRKAVVENPNTSTDTLKSLEENDTFWIAAEAKVLLDNREKK